MSFNNFLSISINPDISLRFARGALTKTDIAGTVFREQTSDLVDKALYYNQLRSIEDNHGNHKESVEYHEKALEIW
jgi:hypothetical protein